jgi:hypothetical protein
LIKASARLKDLDKKFEKEGSMKYWATRLFEFVKKLSELKTALKDEKSLFAFGRFLDQKK